jgi:hypothetical protein
MRLPGDHGGVKRVGFSAACGWNLPAAHLTLGASRLGACGFHLPCSRGFSFSRIPSYLRFGAMTTNKVDAPSKPQSPAAASEPPKASLVRLLVLLGLLVAVIGAYAYDYFVAAPGVDAADKKIQEFVDERNKLGVKEGALVTPADIHKELNMEPTIVENHDKLQYTVEYYCWWDHVPLINMRRHFISVVYVGAEPRRFSSHHREKPPAEALPIDYSAIREAGEKEAAKGEGKAEPAGSKEAGSSEEAKAEPAKGEAKSEAAKDGEKKE